MPCGSACKSSHGPLIRVVIRLNFRERRTSFDVELSYSANRNSNGMQNGNEN